MKLKKYIIPAMAAILLPLSACRDDAPYVINPDSQNMFADWGDVFDSFWNGMNHSYAFWDIDPTDWDQVYTDYRPQFEGLEFGVSSDSIQAVELFKKITSDLIDHHYALEIKDENGGLYALISPSELQSARREDYHESLDPEDMLACLLKLRDEGRVTGLKGAGDTDDEFIAYTCLIDNSIVYFHLNSFQLKAHLDNDAIATVVQQYYDLINGTKDLKGIIIDTRSNGGGSTDDEHLILTPLLSAPHTFGYTRSKIGMGRLDYTPWAPLTLVPRAEVEKELVPRDLSNVAIVGLLDVNSVSMAEITPMAIQELPNGTLIGERSWGGHGPLNGNIDEFYAGELENSAFLMYTSTSMTKRLDGKCYEGIGVIPDIIVPHDEAQFELGNDVQLNRAIDFIRTGK